MRRQALAATLVLAALALLLCGCYSYGRTEAGRDANYACEDHGGVERFWYDDTEENEEAEVTCKDGYFTVLRG